MLNEIKKKYLSFKEKTLIHKRFRYADILDLIERLKKNQLFTVKCEGQSLNDRDIYSVTLGTGKLHVLLWSQMHGNESTATAAIFDIFNFFKGGYFTKFKNKLLSKLTLHFIPMLNPDGAEYFQRQNAIGVDINRDAIVQEMPETQILFRLKDRVTPVFAFNLHDQYSIYNVGSSPNTSTISLLAPEMDEKGSETEARQNAMNLIAYIFDFLQMDIKNHVSRYDDSFSPRCVGDQFQKSGVSTVLVESGTFPNDPERQKARESNVFLLLHAFDLISKERYKDYRLEDYFKIPLNDKKLFDFLLRDVSINYKGKWLKMDIGFRNEVHRNTIENQLYESSIIETIGDLSEFWGVLEFSAKGYDIERGRIQLFHSENLNENREMELLRKGVTAVYSEKTEYKNLIYLRYMNNKFAYNLFEKSYFDILLKKNELIEKALVNGRLINLI